MQGVIDMQQHEISLTTDHGPGLIQQGICSSLFLEKNVPVLTTCIPLWLFINELPRGAGGKRCCYCVMVSTPRKSPGNRQCYHSVDWLEVFTAWLLGINSEDKWSSCWGNRSPTQPKAAWCIALLCHNWCARHSNPILHLVVTMAVMN